MRRNFESKNINVELPISVYEALNEYRRALGIATHLSFFKHVLSEQDVLVYMDILRINDGPKESASMIFVLGDTVYHWDTATFKAMDRGDLLKLIVER